MVAVPGLMPGPTAKTPTPVITSMFPFPLVCLQRKTPTALRRNRNAETHACDPEQVKKYIYIYNLYIIIEQTVLGNIT